MTFFASSSNLPDNLKRFECFADDLTRHWLWAPYVIETRGPFSERKGLFFRGRDHVPLFTRIVGGNGLPPRSPRGGPDFMQQLRYTMYGCDCVASTVNRAEGWGFHFLPIPLCSLPLSSSSRPSPLFSATKLAFTTNTIRILHGTQKEE